MGIGDGSAGGLGNPLMRAGRAFREFPFVAEQVLEKVVVPLRGRGGPGNFQAAGDRVATHAGAVAASPAEALLVEAGIFGIGPHIGRRAGAVGLAEGVAAGDQRHRLLVVHGHAFEGFADIHRRGHRIGIAVGTFGVDVNQPHLHGGQRILQAAAVEVAICSFVRHEYRTILVDALGSVGIANVAAQPLFLGAPINVLIGLPDILATAAETERLESHRFQRHVASQNQQIGPGNLAAVLLLNGPKEPAGLVEAHIVGPTVERRETLLAPARAAAAVANAVGAGAVPSHANEQRPVVPEIGRPPILRVGHQRREIFLHRRQVETLELFPVVEVLAHGVGLGGMLLQEFELQLVRPPVAV